MLQLNFSIAQTSKADFSILISPEIWLKPENTTTTNSNGYVGNYPCLDLTNDTVKNLILDAATKKRGTLFLVVEIPEDGTASFGGITISPDTIFTGGHTFPHYFGAQPGIYKLEFTVSPKFKSYNDYFEFSNDFKIAEVMFFENYLSPEISRQIETYLAIKYAINITKNSDVSKRSYIGNERNVYWNHAIDFNYDKLILGLGRNDTLNFLQTQTWSNDEKVRLSFTANMTKGAQPNVEVADSSLLLLAQSEDLEVDLACGQNQRTLNWKLSFSN